MKLPLLIRWSRTVSRGGRSASTLTEILIAASLFSLVIVGVVYTHVFGLNMATLTNSKLSATQAARHALDRVREDVRSGKILYVGNGDDSTFTRVLAGNPQVGNSLQIHRTTDTNVYVRYYLDLADKSLKRKTSDDNQVEEIANYITNQIAMVFRAEDYLGNTLTSDQNNRVIKMTLEFFQWEFPITRAGGGNYYDHYRLQTRITRRAIE
jgi:type II secretory pathway pseudopilin PulG